MVINRKAMLLGGVFLVFGTLGIFFFIWLNQPAPMPKPKGYNRISVPGSGSQTIQSLVPKNDLLPYDARVHESAIWKPGKKPGWGEIRYPWCKSILHLQYFPVNNDLKEILLNTQKQREIHNDFTDGIRIIEFPNGLLFNPEGPVASPVQFILTDSTNHLLFGYADVWSNPHPDSLAPVNRFLMGECINVMRTLNWEP